MKRLTLFTAVVFILFSYSTAFADRVQITIESYANPALGVKSTVIELTDPYDANDTDDQLEMAYQAILFALSSDGWDFTNEGFYTPTQAECGALWGTGVNGNTYLTDPTYYESLLGGYVLNSEALWAINNTPTNQATGLSFHTDAWCSKQPPHMFCDDVGNYGQISQVMAGVFMQCAVPEWGFFTVEQLPPGPTLEERVEALEAQMETIMGEYESLQDRFTDLETTLETLSNHSHEYLTGEGAGHNNTPADTGPPIPVDGQ